MGYRICSIVFAATIAVLVYAPRSSAQPDYDLKNLKLNATVYRDPFSDRNKVGGPTEYLRGEHIFLRIAGVPEKSLIADPKEDWHTYPLLDAHLEKWQIGTQQPKVVFLNPSSFGPIGNPTEVPEPQFIPTVKGALDQYYEQGEPFVWTWELVIRPEAKPGPSALKVRIDNLLVCNEKNGCNNPQTVLIKVPITISKGDALAVSQELQAQLAKLPPDPHEAPVASVAPPPKGLNEIISKPIEDISGNAKTGTERDGLLATILTALAGGLIALVTPCVFPMVPVTVSYFLKQSEKTHTNPLVMATVYCLTIVAVLTAGGVALVSVLQSISQHWLTNIFLAGVFIFFALSLLGMYEIQLPTGLSDLTAKRQSKGGLLGVVFMALTFSIISFACVGPIYGSFITLEATATATGWLRRILGPLAFAISFASPFFVLALFPSLLQKLPKRGSWMNSVKVVMGFLELAAAFKFVRGAELNLLAGTRYFTYDVVLGIYIAIAVACGLYLLGVFRLPHDYAAPQDDDHAAPGSISVPRLLWSLVFLGFGFYLLPAMIKDEKGNSHPPDGTVYAWVGAFLLHEDTSSGWSADLVDGMARAKREGKPLFIDFTGQLCNNCKLNENTIFNQAEVESEFKNFVVVRLYTDTVPSKVVQVPDADTATNFRKDKLNNFTLPYYVVLQPTSDKIYKLGAYDKALIESPKEFVDFLQKARARAVPRPS